MLRLSFDKYEVELVNESEYTFNSSDNAFNYHLVYQDNQPYQGSKHGIKVFLNGGIYQSAIVKASGGATGIYYDSAIVDNHNLLVCCSNQIFCLSLPDLNLNWMTKVDMATCFGIYKTDDTIITWGEMTIARLDRSGNILWSTGFRDIIFKLDDSDGSAFLLRDKFVEITDFAGNKYKVDFDGKIIEDIKSDLQKRSDLAHIRLSKKPWWKFWK